MQEENTDYTDLTNRFKEICEDGVSPITYTTWVSPLDIVSINENNVKLLIPQAFYADQLRSYIPLFCNCFKQLLNNDKDYNITFISKEDLENVQDSSIILPQGPKKDANLNSQYTFNNFVIGENNRFAHAASLAVAEAPGIAYNPLFIYGGVGLGKTHLMHAIGNEVLKRTPYKKVLYVTSETFTNEFINGIKDNSNENFRKKYRNVDVLLIDDIQFIAGKEGIQEEFFHTFNSICENKGQIVLTSDKPPKDINPLEERLKSRFDCGLLVDISAANYETRLAILRKKVQVTNTIVDDIVLSAIAEKIDTNIRELEGVLNKIVAKASLTHQPITLELADQAIRDVIAHRDKVISPEYIKNTVAKYFNIPVEDLDSSKRSNEIAYPRQVAMYFCRELAKMQYKSIGNSFGKRDHSTVMHACNKIEQELKHHNAETIRNVDFVKNTLLKPQEG